MDERNQHMFKSKIRGTVQDVIFPDFPDDDSTVTTTVTRSRRVSFGTNFVKEFIVGSAVSAQCVSEYEQAFSSSDSSNANSSHSAVESGILDQNTFVLDGSQKLHQVVPPVNPEPDPGDNRAKRPKFSSTICFSADSPTADMEFTEGCITLAKSILDKKNKEMTVIIQAKPKEPKEEKSGKEEKCFGGSQFETSKSYKSKENKREEKWFEEEKTNIFGVSDNEMSITKCEKIFKVKQSKIPNDDNGDDSLEDNCKENQIPLDMIMQHLDKDSTDLEKSLFYPEKSLSDVLSANLFNVSNESEKLNLNESMDISRDFQPNFFKTTHVTPLQVKNDGNQRKLPDPVLISSTDDLDEEVFKCKDEAVVKEVSKVKRAPLLETLGVSVGIEKENNIQDFEMEITLAKGMEMNWNVTLVQQDDGVEEMEIEGEILGEVVEKQMDEKTAANQVLKTFEHDVDMDMSLTKVNKTNISVLESMTSNETLKGGEFEKSHLQQSLQKEGENLNQLEELVHQSFVMDKDKCQEMNKEESGFILPSVQDESEILANEIPESSTEEMKSEQHVSNSEKEDMESTYSTSNKINEVLPENLCTKITENETYNVNMRNLTKIGEASISSLTYDIPNNFKILKDLKDQSLDEVGLNVSQNDEPVVPVEEEAQKCQNKPSEEVVVPLVQNDNENVRKVGDRNVEVPKVIETDELDEPISVEAFGGRKTNEMSEHQRTGNLGDEMDFACMSLTNVSKAVLHETTSDETSKRVDVRRILEEHETSSQMKGVVLERGEPAAQEVESPEDEELLKVTSSNLTQNESEIGRERIEIESPKEQNLSAANQEDEMDLTVPNKEKTEINSKINDILSNSTSIQNEEKLSVKRSNFRQSENEIHIGRVEGDNTNTESSKDQNLSAASQQEEMELTVPNKEKAEINSKISDILSNSTSMQGDEMLSVRRSDLRQSENEIHTRGVVIDNISTESPKEQNLSAANQQEEMDLTVPNKEKAEINSKVSYLLLNSTSVQDEEMLSVRSDLRQSENEIHTIRVGLDNRNTESSKEQNTGAANQEEEMELTVPNKEIVSKINEILSNSTPMQNEEMEKYFEKDPDGDLDNFLQKEAEVMEVESDFEELKEIVSDDKSEVSMTNSIEEEVDQSAEVREGTKPEREPPLADAKVIQCLKDQSNETGCVWSLKSLCYPENEDKGMWSFEFGLLESSTTVKFALKASGEGDFDCYSLVTKSEIFLNKEKQFRFSEYKQAVGFGFEKQKTYFEEEGKKVNTVRLVPYFLDQLNSFTSKLNSYLRQIDTILNSYPGSRLKGSYLSFRLFSFPIFFSSTVSIDLTDLFRLSRSSLSFELDFGTLDENKIRDIFQECLKSENGLCEFIIRSTKYLFDLERESGYVSKRNHIRLLPLELKL